MADNIIRVPIARPPSYVPAWAEKPPGLRVSRTLDLGDLLADRGQHIAGVSVELEPPLVADTFTVSEHAITFFLADAPAAAAKTRWRVMFLLQYSGGGQDQIVAWQPVGVASPTGLVIAGSTANAIAVGGAVITIAGETL